MIPISLRDTLVIILSLLFALVISILPLSPWITLLWPQWLALVLIYWVIIYPHRVNIGMAWLFGILLDVLYGTVLGEHALALTIVIYLAYRLHQQIRVFPLFQQALWVFFLILLYQALLVWIQGMLGLLTNVYLFWLSAVTSMLLWPWLYILLRKMQHRPRVY